MVHIHDGKIMLYLRSLDDQPPIVLQYPLYRRKVPNTGLPTFFASDGCIPVPIMHLSLAEFKDGLWVFAIADTNTAKLSRDRDA